MGSIAEWAKAHFFVKGEKLLPGVLERVREIAERVAATEGLEVVAVELHGRGAGSVLRIIVDKPGGISHRECEQISQQVGTILDVEDVMAARYILEVASPGLDRKLYNPSDYERFKGNKVKLQLKAPQAGRRRIEGLLLGLSGGFAQVRDASGEVLAVALGEIEKANLVPDFGRELAARSNPKRRHSR